MKVPVTLLLIAQAFFAAAGAAVVARVPEEHQGFDVLRARVGAPPPYHPTHDGEQYVFRDAVLLH